MVVTMGVTMGVTMVFIMVVIMRVIIYSLDKPRVSCVRVCVRARMCVCVCVCTCSGFCVLYLGGLDEQVTEAILKAAFIPFGDIIDVIIPLEHNSSILTIPAVFKHLYNYWNYFQLFY